MTKKLVRVITEKLLEGDTIERYLTFSSTADYARSHRLMPRAHKDALKIAAKHGIDLANSIGWQGGTAFFYASVPERKRKIYINSVREAMAHRIAQGIIAAGLIGYVLPEKERHSASVKDMYDLRRTLARANEMKDIKV